MDDELERVLEAAFDGGNAAAKKISDYIDKIMGGIPVWISVEDCLPANGEEVLALTIAGRMFVLHHHERLGGGRWGHQSLDDDACRAPVTHWMPLPAPPQTDR